MIKGVNKQILEVTNPDSPYFEKIIFFVKPESQMKNEQILHNEAEKLSKGLKKPPKTRKSTTQKLFTIFEIFMGIGAGVALTFIMNSFLH